MLFATSNLEKANLLNASFMNNYNHALPGPTLNDLPPVFPYGCRIDFLCTEEVYGLLSTLDTARPTVMKMYQSECSRRLH